MPDHKNTIMTKFLINGTEVKGLDLDSIPVPDGEYGDRKTSTQKNKYVHSNALDMYDPGECDISGISIPGDLGQQALDAAFRNRTECVFQVQLVESGVVYQYPGLVKKFNPRSETNTARFYGKILANGLFTSSVTFATVTKIETTKGVVIPNTASSSLSATNNTILVYEAPGEPTDTFKVTAADAILISYSLDGGQNWTSLTSGVVSSDISIGTTDAATHVLVRVEEDNKATRYINMLFTNSTWDRLKTSSDTIQLEQKLEPPQDLNFGFTLPNIYIGSDGQNPPEFYTDCDLEILRPRGKIYYVSMTGSSSNDGLTPETPLGLIEDAIEMPDVDEIILAPGVYSKVVSGNGYWIGGLGPTARNMSIRCPNGRAIISQRQSFSDTTWVLETGKTNTYRVLRTNTGRVFDSSVIDSHGDYTELTHVTSIDDVEATANSWYTDESNVYVHTSDNRVPGEEIYLFFKVLNGLPIANTYTYYLENIDLEGGASPFQLSHGTIYAKNCTFKYGTESNGVTLLGSNAIFIGCTAAKNVLDGFNYHKSGPGLLCNAVEIDCIGRDNGGTWINTNKIDNGSTAHDGCKVVRVNGQYLRNYGPNCIDITNSRSWNLNCASVDTKLTNDTSSSNAGFSCLSGAIMWLDSCMATGTYYTTYVELSNGTGMYYTNSKILFLGI